MNKLRKYGIILTTIMTIFTSSLIVTKADTMPVIQAAHELYIPFPATSPNAYACRGVISINFDSYVTGTLTTTIVANDNIVLNFNSYVDFYCIGAEATVTGNETRITFHIEDEKTILLYYVCTYVATGTAATIGNLSVDLTYRAKTLDVISHVDATDVNQISGQMATLLNTMNNIYDQDATMLTKLTTLNTKTDTIISQLTTLTTAVNNIDAQIDTISWNELNNAIYGWKDISDNIYTDMSKLTNTYNYPEFMFMYNTQFNQNALFMIEISFDNLNRFDTLNIYYNYGSNLSKEIDILYYRWTRYKLYVYFTTDKISIPYTNPWYISVKVNQGRFFQNAKLCYIEPTDIEYWQLLQAINNYNYQKEQLNLTQELIDIVSQLTSSNSTETTENITNFNTNMEIVNNIENNISADFGNSKTIFDFNESNKWSFNEDLRTPTNSLNSVFTATINAVTPANTWLSLILLCAVLMAILG